MHVCVLDDDDVVAAAVLLLLPADACCDLIHGCDCGFAECMCCSHDGWDEKEKEAVQVKAADEQLEGEEQKILKERHQILHIAVAVVHPFLIPHRPPAAVPLSLDSSYSH